MTCKRRLSDVSDDSPSRTSHAITTSRDPSRAKRPRVSASLSESSDHLRAGTYTLRDDFLSSVSDEVLLRVLSNFSPPQLLAISLTSKRFHRLTSDSQLWRPHFYRRFVLPRAHLIPGFRSSAGSTTRRDYKLHFAGRRSLWADGGHGRRGTGLVTKTPAASSSRKSTTMRDTSVDWRQAYKLRHNWERGRCAVEELPLYDMHQPEARRKTFARFVDGLAVTVDSRWGLRVWDLKTRKLVAQQDLGQLDATTGLLNQASCLAVDGGTLETRTLGICAGFEDGSFEIWTLDVDSRRLQLLRRHKEEKVGGLVSVAYLHPYVMTATDTGFILLYTFEVPDQDDESLPSGACNGGTLGTAPRPYLLNSLKSRDTRPARALSIRKMASSVVASFAWTFDTIGGWCIAVQDLDIRPSSFSKPDIVTSRMASTLPTPSRRFGTSSPEGSPLRLWWPRNEYHESDSDSDDEDGQRGGPVRLCYSHPYLLATMPDNTLILHLCTSTATSLTISPGTRLFGHTSGISDAVITPGGKAVSVSTRGDEIRLWELEGGIDKQSVSVRPTSHAGEGSLGDGEAEDVLANLEEKRNWVGFDEEMVIVLKEKGDGRESFMVYDFT